MLKLLLCALLSSLVNFLALTFWSQARKRGISLRATFSELNEKRYTAEFVDLLLLSRYAGLSIPRAFVQSAELIFQGCQPSDAPLPLRRVSALLQAGVSFGEAIEENKQESRDGDPKFQSCTRLFELLQVCLRLGNDAETALTSLSLELRRELHAALEESNSRAALGMLFPVVLLLLPTLFILFAAPVLLEFLHDLTHLPLPDSKN